MGSKTGVNVSVLVGDGAPVCTVREAEAAPEVLSVLEEVLEVMQRLGRKIGRPVLPELPASIRLAGPLQRHPRATRTRFDPGADVRTVGGWQAKEMRATDLIDHDGTGSPGRSSASTLLELGAVWSEQERLRNDSLIPPLQRLFVYIKPRRFPRAGTCDWASRLVFQSRDFVVVNKPGGGEAVRSLAEISLMVLPPRQHARAAR